MDDLLTSRIGTGHDDDVPPYSSSPTLKDAKRTKTE